MSNILLTEETFTAKMSEKKAMLDNIASQIEDVVENLGGGDIDDLKNLCYPKITITGFPNTDITLTQGNRTITVTPDSTGIITVAVPLLGTWTVSTVDSGGGGTTYRNTVRCDTIGGSYRVVLKRLVYGVSWDGTSTTSMTRTGDAANFSDPVPAVNGGSGSSPFDNCYPWSEMEKVTIDGNALVKIPKFWYKITKTGDAMTFEITNRATDGFLVSPAHAYRGDGKGERDYVYIGRYKCNSVNWKSTSGVLPKTNATMEDARKSITNLGLGYYSQDFALFWTTRLLYIVEYADWNSQAKIGYGGGNNSSFQDTGASDDMVYHTGTMQSDRTTYGVGVQYRWIEDPWGNVEEWCDGIRFAGTDNASVYVSKYPLEYSNSTGGIYVCKRDTNNPVYIRKWNVPSHTGYEWALYPIDRYGSDTTYVTDACYCSTSGTLFSLGGGSGQKQDYGFFCMYGNNSTQTTMGARLQYLP